MPARLLVLQRSDASIEQGQGRISLVLLISRQRQIAADRQIARVQCAGALQELRRFVKTLRSVCLRRVGDHRFDLLPRGFGDALQPLFGIRVEQHVLGGQVLSPGLEQPPLVFRGPAQSGQPLRLRFFCLPCCLSAA